MYRFPEGLYADIRIEHTENAAYSVQNGEVKQNNIYDKLHLNKILLALIIFSL